MKRFAVQGDIEWIIKGQGQRLTREEAMEAKDICNAAVSRLSPATRRLLIERPEAVEACVEAIRLSKKVKSYPYVPSKALLIEEWIAKDAKAIAALPEETTP